MGRDRGKGCGMIRKLWTEIERVDKRNCVLRRKNSSVLCLVCLKETKGSEAYQQLMKAFHESVRLTGC